MHRRKGLTAAIVGVISIALVVGAVGTALAADNTVSAKLSGKNEVLGPGDDDGSGEVVLKLKKKKARISFNVRFEGIQNPVEAHIHKGTKKVADDHGCFFCGPARQQAVAAHHINNVNLFVDEAGVTSPVSGRDVDWSQSDTRQSKRNKIGRIKNDPNDWYVNLHTPDFPDGAIRGQLKPGG